MTDRPVIPSIEQLRQRAAIPSIEQLRQRPWRRRSSALRRRDDRDALRAAADALREPIAAGDAGRRRPRRSRSRRTQQRLAPRASAARCGRSSTPPASSSTPTSDARRWRAAALERVHARRPRLLQPRVRPRRRAQRGSRTVHAEALLAALTGAEAAVVVNNNAAATLLMLGGARRADAKSSSRAASWSRSAAASACPTSWRSRARCCAKSARPTARASPTTARRSATATALLLRVHPSNFRIEGFTERPTLDELVAAGATLEHAARRGSRQRLPRSAVARADEPDRVQASDRRGAASTSCASAATSCSAARRPASSSARAALVDRLRRHPLMRALRVDKLTLAALEATLLEYLAGRAARPCRSCG